MAMKATRGGWRYAFHALSSCAIDTQVGRIVDGQKKAPAMQGEDAGANGPTRSGWGAG
jgi:hypothetical protein